jgi:3-hydroxyacyl-[acyl-carrier-protein] dehydratase
LRFILIDEILELIPGKRIKATKTIAPEADVFLDHFPGFPVVPGVLQTEMMAQAAGKCLVAEDESRGKPMLARINSATFRNWIRPGDTALITVEIKSSRPQFGVASGFIEVKGVKVSSAELFFTFLPMTAFAPGYSDELLNQYLTTQGVRHPGASSKGG